jgi:hypothetical protein
MNILNRSLPAGKKGSKLIPLGALLQFHETQMELDLVTEELCKRSLSDIAYILSVIGRIFQGLYIEFRYQTKRQRPRRREEEESTNTKNELFKQVESCKTTDTKNAEKKLAEVIRSLQRFTVSIYPLCYKPRHMRALAALLAKGIRRRNCPGASEIYTASI